MSAVLLNSSRLSSLNHVRVPVGYWAFDVSGGEPYIQGQVPYLWKAVSWARNHGLKMIVDLHGAPGSQNGFDNSGQKMSYPTWHTQQSNIDRTNNVIKQLTDMFKDQSDVVTAIQALNE
jgi:glucan 1,3-beta-glucosidase